MTPQTHRRARKAVRAQKRTMEDGSGIIGGVGIGQPKKVIKEQA